MLEEKGTLVTFRICLTVSILLHFATSLLSIGYHHGDEHYQILEFAGLKLGFNNPVDLAWEYHYKMRSAFQPFFAILMIKSFNALSFTNPFAQAIVFRIISSTLSISSIVVFIWAFVNDFVNPTLKKWFIATSLLLWIIIYTDVRFSSEGWSASFITLGIAMLKFYLDGKIINRRSLYLFLAGFIMGLSFVCRYQTGFFIFGLGLWLIFINKTTILHLFHLSAGILLAVVLGAAIDSWFYGTFTMSSINYFTQNILENKASNYGVSKWWYYLTNTIEDGYVFFGLLSILSFLIILIKKPKHIFVWSILPFVIIHSLIGHKESRFLFPILKFAPYLVFLAFTLLNNYKPILTLLSSRILFYSFLFINLILTGASCFTPADYSAGVMNYIYHSYKEQVTLYYINNNPYESYGLYNNYYRTKNVIWHQIEDPSKIQIQKEGETLLVVSNKTPIKDTLGISFHKVYQPIPKVFTDNLKGWASRHTMQVVYKCEIINDKKK
jgi:phosphatidylinositol glycan class B